MQWQNLLDRFIRHLALEKGLSDNTLLAYENDLKRYIQHLANNEINNIEQLIDRADLALLDAKALGRNRVVVWNPKSK